MIKFSIIINSMDTAIHQFCVIREHNKYLWTYQKLRIFGTSFSQRGSRTTSVRATGAPGAKNFFWWTSYSSMACVRILTCPFMPARDTVKDSMPEALKAHAISATSVVEFWLSLSLWHCDRLWHLFNRHYKCKVKWKYCIILDSWTECKALS